MIVEFKKFIVSWVVFGTVGAIFLGYPTYDKEGTVDLFLVVATVAGPFATILGLLELSNKGYTTIALKEVKQ